MTDIYGSESKAMSAENAFLPIGDTNITMAHLDCLRVSLNNRLARQVENGGSKDVCDVLILVSEAIFEMQMAIIGEKFSGEPL
jgi:hypothetical protein